MANTSKNKYNAMREDPIATIMRRASTMDHKKLTDKQLDKSFKKAAGIFASMETLMAAKATA